MSKKKETKLLNLVNNVYQYSQSFDSPLKPRGDGARYEAGKEVHDVIQKMFDYAIDNGLISEVIALSHELVERIILDKIDITLEEIYKD